MTINSAQDNRFIDPQANIWVDASAGSGKTYRLVERFTALLLSGVPAEKILCLTYTRAAAAEMRQRILHNLSGLSQHRDDDLRALIAQYHQGRIDDDLCRSAQNLLYRALDLPNGLMVMTIHAYCQSVISRFPLESGIFPGTEVIADSTLNRLAQETLEDLLESAFAGSRANLSQLREAFQTLAAYCGLEQLRDLLTQMSALVVDGVLPPPAVFETQMRQFFASDEAADEFQRIIETSLAALVSASGFHTLHQSLKAHRGVMDYQDLIVKMHRLLDGGDAAWVLYKCDGGFSHILLDEAQDTSPRQWQIIRNLCENLFEKGTLFVVGDPKQSIFSFQGADIDSFHGSREYFERQTAFTDNPETALRRESLDVSRRSCRQILDFVNGVFAPHAARLGLPEQEDWPSHQAHRQEARDQGYVEIWPALRYDRGESQSAYQRLAAQIAQRIEEILQSGTHLPGTGKPVQPGDVMILLRKRDALAYAIIHALQQQHIPVTGLDHYQLSGHIIYDDVMAVLEFVNLPDNDFNLACLLKSPFVGIDDAALDVLAQGRLDEGRSLFAHLRGLSRQDGDESCQAIVEWLESLLVRADVLTPFEFLHQLLHESLPLHPDCHVIQVGKARLGDETKDILQTVLRLAQDYEQQAPVSLYGFMAWLGRSEAKVKRDFAALNRVKIRTIHSAKGLEAPIVFLPYLGKNTPPRDAFHLYPAGALSNENGDTSPVPLWLPYADWKREQFKHADDTAKRKKHEESFRLLYVALTRAQDQLYLMGAEQATQSGAPELTDSNRWYGIIENFAPACCTQTTAFGTLPPSSETKVLPAAFEPIDLPDWVRQAPPSREDMPVVQPSRAAHLLSEEEPPPHIQWPEPASEAMRHASLRGTLIHQILQHLPVMLETHALDVIRDHAARFFERHGFTREDAERDADAVTALAKQYPQFFHAHEASRSEQAVIGELILAGKNRMVSGVIDRLIVTQDEIVLLDYKTGTPDARKQKHYRQALQLYAQLIAPLYPQKNISAGLLWVDELQFQPIEIAIE